MSLDRITDPLLDGARHGFFGRAGGVSSGVYAGLNCGPGSGDQAEAVAINRGRVAEALGVASDALAGVHQVHSSTTIAVTSPPDPRPRADALVTATPGIALTVLTADCQPVLFHDPEARVIGAAHAGWRGTVAGVLEATLDAMETLGARRDRTIAVIGPCISQRAYEVGPDLFDAVLSEDEAADRHFAHGPGDRLLFDLPGYGLARLRRSGVAEARWTRHCTHSDPDRFFSYRRTTQVGDADYGRLIAAIAL